MDDYQDHIVKGKIQLIGGDYLQLGLSNNKGKGRLQYENMLKPPARGTFDKHISIGETFTVFLEQNDKDDRSWWRLNERWVEDNPWLDLSIGEMVYGTVTSYYKDIAAFVRLEGKSGLSAFLHITETPRSTRSIQEVLEVGDHVYAEIININPEQLKADISIKSPLERMEKSLSNDSREKLILQQVENQPLSHPSLSKIYWLIIEDDHTLFGRLKCWAEDFGCTVVRAGNLQHLEQILKKHPITHASIDANLHNYKKDKQSIDYIKIIKRFPHIKTVVMSGKKKSNALASQFGVPFILKPVSESLLLMWLQNHIDGFQQSLKQQTDDWEDEAVHWQADGLEYEIKKQATDELKQFAIENQCIAALIALKAREGVIQIRMNYGLIQSDIEKTQHQLIHTLISTIIETGTPEERDLSNLGVLLHILPLDATHAFGFPITVEKEHDRAVVFFKNSVFSKSEKKALMDIVPFLESLGSRLLLIQAWEEDRAFANLGRLSTAVMHELRNNIGFIKAPVRKLKNIAKSSDLKVEDLREQINSLEERYRSVEKLLENNLNLIRQYRHGQFSLHETLERLVSFYQYEFENEKNSTLVIEGNIPKIRLDFPVLAFEQTIINIMQNALYHIPKDKGHVSIRVLLRHSDSNGHSVFIDIADNGSGIPASMKDKVFKPRETAKGSRGTGMGLYVSRNLLQAHGGDLTLADSIRYFGTCFRIALPRNFGDVR